MSWYAKSLTVVGAVVGIASAVFGFLNGISPEVSKLLETIAGFLVILGLRKKMQSMNKDGE